MKRLVIAVVTVLGCVGLLASPAAAKTTTECNGTLSGTYDRILVPDGATCTLDGATVTGNVTAGAGSSLFTSNATIGGNVMTRDSLTVQIIRTDVGHNIMVTGTTGLTKIGGEMCKIDPSTALNLMVKGNSGNTAICSESIGRNFVANGNSGSVSLFRSTVGNNALVFDNTGNGTRLKFNAVSINLNCHGNTGKLVLKENTAKQFLDQCA
jgi:hypothetical protein